VVRRRSKIIVYNRQGEKRIDKGVVRRKSRIVIRSR
jgi:hypothetical protein